MNIRFQSSSLAVALVLVFGGSNVPMRASGATAMQPDIAKEPSSTTADSPSSDQDQSEIRIQLPDAEIFGASGTNAMSDALDSNDRVTMRAALSHGAYTQSDPKQLLFRVEFSAARLRRTDRPRLNIALVLDRSGSMADDMKFPHAIQAAHAVIENLTDQDIVSLVAFNERPLVLSPAGRVVNKPFLFQRLSEVAPAGITDLSAGLLEGIAQVRSQGGTGQVRQVFILTDGQANTGVIEPEALRRLAESAHRDGVGVSTLGCGTDFNQKLLADLAIAGGGRYTYVKSAEQLPSAFQSEMRGLLEVVAQNVKLEIVANPGARISKVYGQPTQTPTSNREVLIGNLRAGEHGAVMVEVSPSSFRTGAVLKVSSKLTFDVPELTRRVVRAMDAQAEFAAGDAGSRIVANEEVVLCGAVMQAMDLAISALEGFDSDRYARARKGFDQSHGQVRQFALTHHNQDLLNEAFLLKHFMDELDALRTLNSPGYFGDAKSQIEKQADYDRYRLLHHDVTQTN